MDTTISAVNRELFEAEDQLLQLEAALDHSRGLLQRNWRHQTGIPNPEMLKLWKQYRSMIPLQSSYRARVADALIKSNAAEPDSP